MLSEPLLRWLAYVGVGGLLLLTVIRLPEKVQLFVGRYLSPNWISVIHAPIAWVGYFWLYKEGHLFAATLVLALSGALDKLDGGMAATLDRHLGLEVTDKRFWAQMSHRGTSPLGKVLDPLMDKITVTPIYIDVGLSFFLRTDKSTDSWIVGLLYFGAGLILFMILTDIFGQVLRLERFKKWRYKKDGAATRLGQAKALGQWIWLIFYPIWEQGWLPDFTSSYLFFLNILLTAILVLACLSVVSKIRPLNDSWTKTFSH